MWGFIVGCGKIDESRRLYLSWELVELDGSGHGHVLLEPGEADVDELLRLQRAVVVAIGRNWLGQHDSSCVDGLWATK